MREETDGEEARGVYREKSIGKIGKPQGMMRANRGRKD